MSNQSLFYFSLFITPIIFYYVTKYILRTQILFNKDFSILSRFSLFKHIKKNNIGIAAYLELSNIKNDLKSLKKNEQEFIENVIVERLKKYCTEYKFNMFYLSREKYILVNKNTNINYHSVFDLLIKRLTEPITTDRRTITTKVNIGAVTSKSLPKNAEELLDIIISSCHIAKNSNTNFYLIMDLDNPKNVEKNYGLDDSGPITTHYMCLYDTKKVKIVGCETLARWKNREKILSPNVFIPLAIKRNLISNIDFGIAEDAFKNYLTLIKKNLIDENFILAINVAKESLTDSYIKRLENLIKRYKDVPVGSILLDFDMEIFKGTENVNRVIKLQEIGFKVCVDNVDFNFEELINIYNKIPYDNIKVTTNHYLKPEFPKFRQFLLDNDVQVIATKIEKIDELHALINNDVNLVQGFLYGKPTKFEGFVEQIWSNNVFRV